MPVTVSYPGLYLEEIPSNARSIAAAPTSVAVFVGYAHPFKTGLPGQPVRVFNFTDYERAFGGIFQSAAIDTNLGHAVFQFFLNGGSDAYVVGLTPKYHLPGPVTQAITPASVTQATTGGGIVFTAREPTDLPQTAISISIENIRSGSGGPLDLADYTIAYGSRIENYRSVRLNAADFDKLNQASSLLSIAPNLAYGTAYPANPLPPLSLAAPPPATLIGTFDVSDFAPVFQSEQPLDKVDVFNLLIVPGITESSILSAALAFAERKQAFMIMDPPANAGADPLSAPDMSTIFRSGVIPKSINGAIFFPYLKSTSPVNGAAIELPPSGFVAGIFARTDTKRGVWKAPAGLEALINNTTGVVDSGRMTDQRHGILNREDGVNCLRTFPGVGTVVFGSRTLVAANVAFQQYKYIPVRRMTLFIEQTLLQNLKWIVFESNDEPLWLAIRTTIENFMLSLFNQQALQGATPSQAFQVTCDHTTTTADDQANGIVNILVAFAPLKPAEFVVIKVAHLAGQTEAA
jgi:phage tail sheath protein FI